MPPVIPGQLTMMQMELVNESAVQHVTSHYSSSLLWTITQAAPQKVWEMVEHRSGAEGGSK